MSASPVVNAHHPDLQRWRLPWPPEDQPRRLSHWTIHGAYVSTIACALHLTPEGTPDDTAREELLSIMNMFRMRAYDRGYAMPILAVVAADGEGYARTLREWAAESEWTGGRFVLLPVPRSSEQMAGSAQDPAVVLLDEQLSPESAIWNAEPLHWRISFAEAIQDTLPRAGSANSLMTRLVEQAPAVDADPGRLKSIVAQWLNDAKGPWEDLMKFRWEP